MFNDHYAPLFGAYLTALAGWLAANRVLALWPRLPVPQFEHPRREFVFAVVGCVGIIGVGQLWNAGIKLPERGLLGPIAGAINQLVIFAPILVVIVLRRQPWSSAWLPKGKGATRLFVGLALSALAILAYSLLRSGAVAPGVMLTRIWQYDHLDEMVQVFLEDVTIAILFTRLAAAIGPRWATAIVAALFAAGHVPTMIANGATALELAGLFRDAILGGAVIMVLRRSQDVLWFWPVHFALDMTQFTRVTGIG